MKVYKHTFSLDETRLVGLTGADDECSNVERVLVLNGEIMTSTKYAGSVRIVSYLFGWFIRTSEKESIW